MAAQFLYLTTKGRTTGEPRRIEIWFVELRGCHYVVAEMGEEAGWVKNLARDAAVTFSVGTRANRELALCSTRAMARALREAGDTPRIAEVRKAMDAKYRWSEGLVVEISRSS